MKRLLKVLGFIATSVVFGLALAFLIIAWRPELVRSPAQTPAALNSAVTPEPSLTAATPAPVAAPPTPSDQTIPASALPARTPVDGPADIVLNAPEHTGPAHDAWSYAEAVRRAGPAVVNIYTTRTVTEQVAPVGLEALFGGMAPRERSRTERSLGSGVIVDSQGHIATNNHVIENSDEIRVQLADHRFAAATVVGRDPDSDLALLKITLPDLPVMPLGNSGDLQVGDVVLAIGNPMGLQATVTHGIVSAKGRGQLGLATFENFIQTDAPINPGNSGGALINPRGELVGINTAILDKRTGAEGIGFAIPVNMVRGVIRDLITNGKVARGWIGIIPEDFPDDKAQRVGLAHGGVVVVDLYVNSPAVQAGLRPGDILLTIDSHKVDTSQEALARIASTPPGHTLKLTAQRGRGQIEASIAVAQRPKTL